MAAYFGQDLVFLRKLRDLRQQQLLELTGQSSAISAAGYSKAVTGFSLEALKKDLADLEFEITRQDNIATGAGNTRPTCSHTDFSHAIDR